jgi:hypothetical protein
VVGKADLVQSGLDVSVVPCVDGSLLARVFFTLQLVGCGHVFGLLTRFT